MHLFFLISIYINILCVCLNQTEISINFYKAESLNLIYIIQQIF